MANRIEMKLDLVNGIYESYPNVSPVFYEMTEEIAQVMYDSYYGSIEYESETYEDFLDEITFVFKGLYGEFMPNLSSVYEYNNEIIGALLLCIYKDDPMVTYMFTKPGYQRKNIGLRLLSTTCFKLLNEGYKELFLYLNLDNKPAYNLFDKFGFNEYTRKKINYTKLEDL